MVNDKGEVKVIFSPNGGASFDEPIRIDSGNAIGRVDVVLLNEKTAVVSWVEEAAIRIRKISSDGKLEKTIRVAETSEARAGGFPQLTRFANGVIMAWTDEATKTIKTASITW
jgi:hypothetical protein